MKYIASPATAVIEELKKTTSGALATPKSKSRHMGTGKILSITGTKELPAEQYGKVGDIVTFLSYYEEGEYDRQEADGTIIYFVKLEDFRAQVEEEDA